MIHRSTVGDRLEKFNVSSNSRGVCEQKILLLDIARIAGKICI
jgi:hypothetical protein